MKFLFLAVAALSLSLIPSCCAPSSQAIVASDLSPQAAKDKALRDFTAGHPKIYLAGDEAPYAPGIQGHEELVSKVPRDGSLAGVGPRYLDRGKFATAYNEEIVFLLKRHVARHPR